MIIEGQHKKEFTDLTYYHDHRGLAQGNINQPNFITMIIEGQHKETFTNLTYYHDHRGPAQRIIHQPNLIP